MPPSLACGEKHTETTNITGLRTKHFLIPQPPNNLSIISVTMTAILISSVVLICSRSSPTRLRSRRTAASAGWLKRNLCTPPKVITIPGDGERERQILHRQFCSSCSKQACVQRCVSEAGWMDASVGLRVYPQEDSRKWACIYNCALTLTRYVINPNPCIF